MPVRSGAEKREVQRWRPTRDVLEDGRIVAGSLLQIGGVGPKAVDVVGRNAGRIQPPGARRRIVGFRVVRAVEEDERLKGIRSQVSWWSN